MLFGLLCLCNLYNVNLLFKYFKYLLSTSNIKLFIFNLDKDNIYHLDKGNIYLYIKIGIRI